MREKAKLVKKPLLGSNVEGGNVWGGCVVFVPLIAKRVRVKLALCTSSTSPPHE